MLTIKNKTINTKYQSLLYAWHDCERCPLSLHRRSVVMVKGSLPAQILYLGEAPGKDEDAQGEPFVGESGKVLQGIINRLPKHTYAVANVVGCIPWKDPSRLNDPFSSSEIRQPSKEEIAACEPRTSTIRKLVNPIGIVLLGNVPSAVIQDGPICKVFHPAYLLRKNFKAGHHIYEGVILALESFLERVLNV